MEELRKVAVVEDEGMKQGKVLEELEMELLVREAHLEEQHLRLHQHRLNNSSNIHGAFAAGEARAGSMGSCTGS